MQGKDKRKGLLRGAVPACLLLLFCVTSVLSLITFTHMQGNARVINYAGIVRGATQRLVKQELNGIPNEALVAYLDGIIQELASGEGENGLIALPDAEYQRLLGLLRTAWEGLKEEIAVVRSAGGKQRLYHLSETYFELADQTVSAAERYSEARVRSASGVLICLNVGFAVLGGLLWLFERRQREMQLALDLAQNASQAKSAFLSRMSHEIRTPMNGIIGMTAIAQMSLDDRDRLQDCLKKIDLSSGYLLALINDILDMSRIESGKLELERAPFTLPELLDRIYVMFKQRAEDGGVEFSIRQEGLTVTAFLGDHLRLSQVLVNLLSNALKFTPAGGQVALVARQTAVSKGAADMEFIVSDTGIGISEAFQARLFEPFEQEQAATTRQYGGTGLGLAISHSFVKMMGGEITVHSKPGEGSQFTVRLRLERPPQAQAGPQPGGEAPQAGQPLQDLSGIRALVAEDNEINSEIVAFMLESSGAQVDRAFDGKDALNQYAASPIGTYQLILMDIQMPVMDGLEATRAIRALDRPDAKQTAILGLSANAFREDIDKALQSGMNDYVPKPIDMEKLFEVLARWCKGPSL